nr:VCBS repeat-containing protein [Planctomycetaceae bacterium]
MTLRIALMSWAACLVVSASAAVEDEKVDLSPYYGFGEVEVYKLDSRSADLRSADLDGDGRTDLILVDNGHSRLDWLRQREKPPETPEKAPRGEINFVPNSWRFEHVKIAVDREVASLVTGDFNSDGRIDVAYIGKPDRLILRFNTKENPQDWTKTVEQRLPDLAETGVILAAGDLNGDKRIDLAVLGKQKTYIVLQKEDGTLATAEGLMNTSDGLGLVQSADVDGDGRADLCYTAKEGNDQILCSRLQTPQGTLGPEVRFPLSRPRSVTLADVDGEPGREILSIDSTTGRLAVSKIRRPEEQPGELAGRLVQFGFGDQSTRNDRDLAIGDIDGDEKLDVVVTDPAAAQMIVFRQREAAGLDLGTTFPGLVGAKHVRVADLDGDG